MAEPPKVPPPEPAKDPLKDGLASILSGKDGWMKIGVILVVLSGGTNILATKSGTDTTSAEMTQAFREIHDLHEALDDMRRNQQQILQNTTKPTPAPSPHGP